MFPLAEKTLALVKEERKVTADVLEHLRLIDVQKIYAKMGYKSLWDFTTKYLGYSEAAAYRRISAMRFIRDQPILNAKIRTGELSLTTAAKAQTVVVQGKSKSRKSFNVSKANLHVRPSKSLCYYHRKPPSRNPALLIQKTLKFD